MTKHMKRETTNVFRLLVYMMYENQFNVWSFHMIIFFVTNKSFGGKLHVIRLISLPKQSPHSLLHFALKIHFRGVI